jgi:predicted methyltransferase
MEEMKKVVKKYKKLKKYTKSNLFQIQKLSGQKTIVDELIEEFKENPEL